MNYATAAMVGAGIGVIGVWIAANIRHFLLRSRMDENDQPPDVERQFMNIFAIMTADRRQALVRFYMEKHECSRDTAMRIAIDDREREIRRWG